MCYQLHHPGIAACIAPSTQAYLNNGELESLAELLAQASIFGST